MTSAMPGRDDGETASATYADNRTQSTGCASQSTKPKTHRDKRDATSRREPEQADEARHYRRLNEDMRMHKDFQSPNG
jgi:hypothetical protein